MFWLHSREMMVLGAITVLLGVAGCETMDSGGSGAAGGAASTPSSQMQTANTSTQAGPRPAAGQAGDSLQACMDRIPQDATAAQRMLAERTCQRDEQDRQPIKRVPGSN